MNGWKVRTEGSLERDKEISWEKSNRTLAQGCGRQVGQKMSDGDPLGGVEGILVGNMNGGELGASDGGSQESRQVGPSLGM